MDSAPHVEYSACGILRCGPVWCICGHKQMDGLATISNSISLLRNLNYEQTQQMEWIPFDCIEYWGDSAELYGLPAPNDVRVELIPLEITDETHGLYYAEVN